MYNKEKTKEARAVLYGQGAPEKWAQRLMARVYVSFSAALSFDREGRIIELFQFDTFFPEGEIIVAKDAAQVWLMSNHPEGMRRMMQEDWQNLRRVQEAAGGAKVRMFLAGEELGCVEVEIQRRA